jgi:hypothetical protein
MFVDVTAENRDVKLSQDFVDFQFADSGRVSESRMLTVHNKYPFPVDVSWALLNVMSRTTG